MFLEDIADRLIRNTVSQIGQRAYVHRLREVYFRLKRNAAPGVDGLRDAAIVFPADTELPHWLPSIERWCSHAPIEKPALLFARGINAGGYQHNVNRVNTEIRLHVPKENDTE